MTRNDAPDVWEYSLLKGAVCLGLAGAAFVLIAGIVRWLSGSVPLLQIAFIQQIVVVALVVLPRAVSGQVRMTSVGHGQHLRLGSGWIRCGNVAEHADDPVDAI